LYENTYCFLPILPKAASAIIKEFLKADSIHINKFPKAAENFLKKKTVDLSGFRNIFIFTWALVD
jgi:hypothetical protein